MDFFTSDFSISTDSDMLFCFCFQEVRKGMAKIFTSVISMEDAVFSENDIDNGKTLSGCVFLYVSLNPYVVRDFGFQLQIHVRWY